MKILIETSSDDLFLSAIDQNVTVAYIHEKDLLKKADVLPQVFEQLLVKAKISLQDVEAFYVTLGPGSFMGSRTALVFVKAICQVTKIKLFFASTFMLVSMGKTGEYYIDAKGGVFYKAKIEKGEAEYLLANEGIENHIDYAKLIAMPNEYLAFFKESEDILALEPIYLKEPRIGGK